SVVFGGTGVNINDKEDDTDALWFAADKIVVLDGLDGLPAPIPPDPRKRDTIPYAPARTVAPLEAPTLLAGDTIKLFFNAADSTLSAAIVGRPEPECEPGYAIMVNGERHMLTLNAEQKDYTEYWIDSLELKVDDEIVLFDTCAQMTFKVAVKGYEGFEPVGESDTLKVTENAYYQLYLKLIYGADELYVVKLEEPDPSALENIMQNSGLKKFILNGQMYIQHNDRLYNAAGYLLK
ncbi:MAG: hypothetical protein MJZ92_05105, partial [Paludibacteraceae bacterium]|nr:hypothetical protein [Paludibacteraceae bacterium]